MISFNNFRLVKDLYENVAIISRDNRVIFEGSSLVKVLDENDIKLHKILSGESGFNLLDSLHTLQSTRKPQVVALNENKVELVLFTIEENDSDFLFIGLKDKIYNVIKLEHDLKERVKELECLYKVSDELDNCTDIDATLNACCKLTERAFQYPDDVIVNIRIGKKSWGKKLPEDFEIKDEIASDIFLTDEKKGELLVYTKNKVGFLKEENKLTEEVALKISSFLEKEEKTKNLQKQQKILSAKNEALLKLTEECFQRREKLAAFFKAITDIIIVVDRHFNIIMSNKDSIGDSGKCYNKIFKRDNQCPNCPAAESFSSGNNSSVEKTFEEKHLMLRTYPIHGMDGTVERVLEVCRDISSQKKMEDQLIQSYKLASLGKLVAGVAHEINNPNTFILGNLKIVEESFQDIFPIIEKHYQENKDLKIARLSYDVFKENISILIKDMINGAIRTKKIVSDLRNFAKKDDGALTEDVDINYIIKNNLTITRKHINKFASLETELIESLPTFKGSINKLEQVLLNLTINASEAIENDEGLIKIKTDYDEKNQEVVLSVSDNGSGMDDTTLKNIFDPFFTTKRNKGGTGLGLSITYGIIKELNGKIEVTSKQGVGTTFTIKIPVK